MGETDLTADVDFKQLISSIEKYNLLTAGPINQGMFLKNLGIDLRTKVFLFLQPQTMLITCNFLDVNADL